MAEIDEKAFEEARDRARALAWDSLADEMPGDLRDIIAAYLDALKPEAPANGVPVRVCIAVDEENNWTATGALGMPDDLAKYECAECHAFGAVFQSRWVEAAVAGYAGEPVSQGVEVSS